MLGPSPLGGKKWCIYSTTFVKVDGYITQKPTMGLIKVWGWFTES